MRDLLTTIVACITGPGPSAVAIVRASGASSWEDSSRVFEPWKPRHGYAQFGRLANGDEGYALPFEAGRCYTGEPSVEFMLHGSPANVRSFVQLCVQNGMREATRGEFSLRAFMNGRIGLAEAEAVRATVEARTQRELSQAHRQRSGAVSFKAKSVSQALVSQLAALEASIDFGEEVGPYDLAKGRKVLEEALCDLDALIRSAEGGRTLREGLRIAIVGPVNAGKSSLFNAVLRQERAIVTAIPGTTRDTLSETIELGGYPVTLVDTAGLRNSNDPVERLGIERSHEELASAHLIWHVQDATQPPGAPVEGITVWNKCDLADPPASGGIAVSAKTGSGLAELAEESSWRLALLIPEEVSFLSSDQLGALQAAREAVADSVRDHCEQTPPDLMVVQIQSALFELGKITGETATDDLLERLFAEFCIGK